MFAQTVIRNRQEAPEAELPKHQLSCIPACQQDITVTTTSTLGSCSPFLSVLPLLHQLFLVRVEILVFQSPYSYNSVFTSTCNFTCSSHSKLPKGAKSYSHARSSYQISTRFRSTSSAYPQHDSYWQISLTFLQISPLYVKN